MLAEGPGLHQHENPRRPLPSPYFRPCQTASSRSNDSAKRGAFWTGASTTRPFWPRRRARGCWRRAASGSAMVASTPKPSTSGSPARSTKWRRSRLRSGPPASERGLTFVPPFARGAALRRHPALATRLCSGDPPLTAQARDKAGHYQGERVILTLTARLLGFVSPTETGAVGGPPGVAELGRMRSSKEQLSVVIET